MERALDAASLDTSSDLLKVLKGKSLHKQVIANLKAMKAVHPTVIQSTLLDLCGRKRNIVVEASSGSGKTIGALLFTLSHMAAQTENTAMSIGFVVPSHNFINNAYKRLFEVVKHAPIRLVNLDSEKQTEREVGKDMITVFVGSYLSFYKCFQEEKIPIQEFAYFVFDDLEYSISLGNNHKLLQLCRYLTSKMSEEKRNFILVSGNTELETFKELKDAFGVKFTNLRLTSDDQKNQTEELMEANDKDADQRADIIRTMMKQYYFIGSELQMYSCFYLIAKFDVFKGCILIVAETLNDAYKLKVFLDRAHTGEAQVYNTEGVINIRAYNLALFNGASIRYLVVTKDFLSDQKKNKKSIQSLKSIKNIVFFNCELDYNQYSLFLNQFKGAVGLGGAQNVDIGYKVLYLALHKLEEELKPKESLMAILSKQKEKFGQILFAPLPISLTDIDAFVYRVENVLIPITTKRVKAFRLIELKRNILKNKNMKVEYLLSSNTSKITSRRNRCSSKVCLT